MQKEFLTRRQSTCVLIVYVLGSSLVIGVSSVAKQDSWLSIVTAVVMMVPLLFVYGRIMHLCPEKDLFEVFEAVLGKILGKVFTAFITWYALHLGAIVSRNFSEFLHITMLQDTPQLPLLAALIILISYLAKSGIRTLGKWSISVLLIIALFTLITILISFTRLDLSNLEPVAGNGLEKILEGAYQNFTFPFAESVLFLCIAGSIKKQNSPYRIYASAIALSGFILLIVTLRNITVLGSAMINASYFPSYTTARVLHVGDFLSRIENSLSLNYTLSGITKVTVCLLAASKGIARLFGVMDYRRNIMPVSTFMLALSVIIFQSTMEMYGFLEHYQYYAIPFQIIIPVIVWAVAEIRTEKISVS